MDQGRREKRSARRADLASEAEDGKRLRSRQADEPPGRESSSSDQGATAEAAGADERLPSFPYGRVGFEDVRTSDRFFYVDKTAAIGQLVVNGDFYFLARPRMFGKSLLLSTLEALFQGKRELFEGLAIMSDPDFRRYFEWKAYYVIHIDFADWSTDGATVQRRI